MGLDANFYAVNAALTSQVDFHAELQREIPTPAEVRERYLANGYKPEDVPETINALKEGLEVSDVHYFRKHHDLQGFMEELYYKKGGKSESFNCCPVVVSAEDLDRLEADVRGDQLPSTQGFFFGSGNTEYYKDETLECIQKCRAAIADGKTVWYDSWW